jgi:hypothetical protein
MSQLNFNSNAALLTLATAGGVPVENVKLTVLEETDYGLVFFYSVQIVSQTQQTATNTIRTLSSAQFNSQGQPGTFQVIEKDAPIVVLKSNNDPGKKVGVLSMLVGVGVGYAFVVVVVVVAQVFYMAPRAKSANKYLI